MGKKSVASKKSTSSKKPVSSKKSASSKVDEDKLDGCNVPIEKATSDEELPAAEGGVV